MPTLVGWTIVDTRGRGEANATALARARLLTSSVVGRGDRATRRWQNDRIRKKKARDKRVAKPAEPATAPPKRPS